MAEAIVTAPVQGEHWYWPDGRPAYTVVGRNGVERPMTLRDARPLGLYRSVTNVIRTAEKPGLERWKQEQVLLAGLTLPRAEDEPEAAWIRRIVEDSRETARKAAERGMAIHDAIERYVKNGDASTYPAICAGVEWELNWATEVGAPWITEYSFAHPLGYGGKIDLLHPHEAYSRTWVVDVKTKEFSRDRLPTPYDEHIMQLAAYREAGLVTRGGRCAILFVSVTEPGLTHWAEVPDDELRRGWTMFKALLDYTKARDKYDPTEARNV